MYGQLLFCVCGIYFFFITWGILQERISTVSYAPATLNLLPAEGKFRYFTFLNMVQSFVAALISLFFSKVRGIPVTKINVSLLKCYIFAACSSCLASSLGYLSLRYINFPTMIIGKSCKLLPALLMNILIYRKRFPFIKYVTVLLVTLGVAGFMFFEKKTTSSKQSTEAISNAQSLVGVGLLLMNLFLDGVTNATQDFVFHKHNVKSQHMMFFMNSITCMLLGFYLLLNPYGTELKDAISFIAKYPTCMWDVVLFSFCGAMGQNFIYYTLEKFGSLSLITVTVTRKLFTIVISLLYFNHNLVWKQWASVLLVFAALLLESLMKVVGGKSKKE